ncbi:MAG: hypothetical protein ACREEV_16055, partial [Dongiaceae bacterium]
MSAAVRQIAPPVRIGRSGGLVPAFFRASEKNYGPAEEFVACAAAPATPLSIPNGNVGWRSSMTVLLVDIVPDLSQRSTQG